MQVKARLSQKAPSHYISYRKHTVYYANGRVSVPREEESDHDLYVHSVSKQRDGRKHAHLVVEPGLARALRPVRDGDVEVAVVAVVRRARQRALDLLALGNTQRRAGSVEYSLSGRRIRVRTTEGGQTRTHFQWVYGAWGPVENLTLVCVQSKLMSNQPRKAWMSGPR
jgi:hypothetical protein